MRDAGLQDITHLIQLSVAPVFLLTAAGTTLSVLTSRLARIVDRGRAVEGRLAAAGAEDRPRLADELRTIARRARLVHVALTLAAGSALFVCLLIATAFMGYLFGAHLAWALAILFVLATVAFAGALVAFLREVFLAIANFRLGIPARAAITPAPGSPGRGGGSARPAEARPPPT